MKAENSGGKVDYYTAHIAHPIAEARAPYDAECGDIIEALGMTFNEGEAFKALWRAAAMRTLGKQKVGDDAVRNAQKAVFFSQRVLAQAMHAALASRPEAGKLVSTPDHTGHPPVPTGVVPRNNIIFDPNLGEFRSE